MQTQNGATSYTPDNAHLTLFYKALRDVSDETMQTMVRESFALDPLVSMKLLFHLRWCRGGKGERKLFYIALNYLLGASMWATSCVMQNLTHVPTFGTWKDLLQLSATSAGAKLFAKQLEADRRALATKNKVSLAAKWAPSEGKKFDRAGEWVSQICRELKCNRKTYRTEYLVPLRKHLDIVERHMCEDDWSGITYAHVPSVAGLMYATTFRKHDKERYEQYIADVASGKEKMNVSLVFPYQLVEALASHKIPDDQLDTMWNQLVKSTREKLKASGASLQALAIADVSGSMSMSMDGTPMSNSIALSMLWAELCEGPFNSHFYTFSATPKLLKVSGTFRQKYETIATSTWGLNTDLQAVFDDMLSHADMWQVSAEMYPKKLYIFTDNQFDRMTTGGDKTHLEMIEQKHLETGRAMPQIIFWNLRGNIPDFPSAGDRKGVAMVSGFSPSLMRLIMEGKELSPMGILMDAIADPIFDCITVPPQSLQPPLPSSGASTSHTSVSGASATHNKRATRPPRTPSNISREMMYRDMWCGTCAEPFTGTLLDLSTGTLLDISANTLREVHPPRETLTAKNLPDGKLPDGWCGTK